MTAASLTSSWQDTHSNTQNLCGGSINPCTSIANAFKFMDDTYFARRTTDTRWFGLRTIFKAPKFRRTQFTNYAISPCRIARYRCLEDELCANHAMDDRLKIMRPCLREWRNQFWHAPWWHNYHLHRCHSDQKSKLAPRTSNKQTCI